MLPGSHGDCQARHTGSLTGRIPLSLSGGQSLQKALEDKLALDAHDDDHRDLAPGSYAVACPPWSLGAGPLDSMGPFQLEPIAVRGPFHKLAGRGLRSQAGLPAGKKSSCISSLLNPGHLCV